MPPRTASAPRGTGENRRCCSRRGCAEQLELEPAARVPRVRGAEYLIEDPPQSAGSRAPRSGSRRRLRSGRAGRAADRAPARDDRNRGEVLPGLPKCPVPHPRNSSTAHPRLTTAFDPALLTRICRGHLAAPEIPGQRLWSGATCGVQRYRSSRSWTLPRFTLACAGCGKIDIPTPF